MKIQILIGMIASGKSTYARNAAKKGVLCVNDDSIVNMLHADDYTLYNTTLKPLYKSIENHVVASSLLIGRTVLIDRALNCSVEGRKRWVALARSFDATCEAILFKIEEPETHALRRSNSDARGHSYEYWLKVAQHHLSRYSPPDLSEGFDAIHSVSFSDIVAGKVIGIAEETN